MFEILPFPPLLAEQGRQIGFLISRFQEVSVPTIVEGNAILRAE